MFIELCVLGAWITEAFLGTPVFCRWLYLPRQLGLWSAWGRVRVWWWLGRVEWKGGKAPGRDVGNWSLKAEVWNREPAPHPSPPRASPEPQASPTCKFAEKPLSHSRKLETERAEDKAPPVWPLDFPVQFAGFLLGLLPDTFFGFSAQFPLWEWNED